MTAFKAARGLIVRLRGTETVGIWALVSLVWCLNFCTGLIEGAEYPNLWLDTTIT